jgi:hypothetical protein
MFIISARLAVKCPPIAAPKYGRMFGAKCHGSYQAKCFFECNTGYLHYGPRYRECLSNRKWSGEDVRCDGKVKRHFIKRAAVKLYLCSTERIENKLRCFEQRSVKWNVSTIRTSCKGASWSWPRTHSGAYIRGKSTQGKWYFEKLHASITWQRIELIEDTTKSSEKIQTFLFDCNTAEQL